MEELFVSRVRIKLLQLLLTCQEPLLHVREIVRRVDEEINAVRRELSRMEKHGMVSSEWRANRRLYHFRKDYIYYQQLLGFVAKSTGLGGAIIQNRGSIGRIKYAMLSYRYLRFQAPQNNEIDLLIVGQVVVPQLQAVIANEQTKRDYEINYSFMDEAEFKFRIKRHDPFIVNVLTQPKIMLLGDEEELLSGLV